MWRGLVVVLVSVAIGCGSNPGAGDDIDAPVADANDGPPDDGMSSCPVGQWCVEASPVSSNLRAVFAVTTGDVFAVGTGGTILRRANNAWTAMESNTTADLFGVWAANANDVWAVGAAGTVMRFNGSTWAPQAGVTGDLSAVFGISANDVYIAGGSTVFHWDGVAFTPKNFTGSPYSISGTGTNDIWVTGENFRVSHYTGTWATENPMAGNTYFAILAIAPDDVWVSNATPTKETLQFNGTSWTPHAVGTGMVFSGFRGISANDIWGAGGTRVGHWNGSAWTTETPGGPSASLFGIGGAGSYLWVVGSDSLILHRN